MPLAAKWSPQVDGIVHPEMQQFAAAMNLGIMNGDGGAADGAAQGLISFKPKKAIRGSPSVAGSPEALLFEARGYV